MALLGLKSQFSRIPRIFTERGIYHWKEGQNALFLCPRTFLMNFGHFWDFSKIAIFGPLKSGPKWPFWPKNRDFLEYHAFSRNGAYTIRKRVKMRYFYVAEHFWWFLGIFEIFQKSRFFDPPKTAKSGPKGSGGQKGTFDTGWGGPKNRQNRFFENFFLFS